MPTVLHNTLTTTDLHEPKGVSTASAGEFYVADGLGSGTWGTMQYANIYSSHADAVTIATIGTTAKVLAAFSHNGPSSVVVPDYTADNITITNAGDYWVSANIAFATVAAGDSGDYEFHLRVNGVESTIGFHRTMSGSGDRGSAGCSGIITLAASDVLTIYVESDEAGDTDDISVSNVALNVVLMKGA